MTYLMRLNQINFGIITPEKDEPSGLNTYSAKHLCLLMSNMSVYNILCCIRRQLFYERVVQQQWSWWNDWREDHDTKYRNSLVPSGLTWRNPNETIIEKSIRPNFSVSFAPEAKRGCKRKLFELMTYATLERFIRKGAAKMQISVRFTVFLFVAVDKFIFLIPTFW